MCVEHAYYLNVSNNEGGRYPCRQKNQTCVVSTSSLHEDGPAEQLVKYSRFTGKEIIVQGFLVTLTII